MTHRPTGWLIALALAGMCAACTGAGPSDGWIRDWLICGPFQTGGFSMVAPFYETMMQPNAFETYQDEWAPDRSWAVTWRPYHSPTGEVDIDLKDTFADRPAMDWPPGWPPSAYAHLYITLGGQRDALLDFGSTCPARAWLNGEDLTKVKLLASGVPASAGYRRAEGDSPLRGPITLSPGTNRLLIKAYFPQKDYGTGLARPTRFRVRLLDVDGSPMQGLQYDLNNPRLYAPDRQLRDGDAPPDAGSCLADDTDVTVTSSRPRYVFCTDQRVAVWAETRLLSSEERVKRFGRDDTRHDGRTISGRLTGNLLDYDGRVVGRRSGDITFGLTPGKLRWDFGWLPTGHYTLYTWLHVGGELVKSPLPTMISVVPRPHPLPPGGTSKFAHSYYYLGRAEPEFTDVLAAAGARLNIGSMHWWWLNQDPIEWAKKPVRERRWEYYPTSENLAIAREKGLELTGDLGGCFTAEFKQAHYAWWQIPPETKGKLVVINPYWPTYPYDSPEFESLVHEYVTAAVRKWKGQFHYWKLQNEVNLCPGMTPEMWGHILKTTYSSAKDADPGCVLVNASMSGAGLTFLEPLFQQGYDRYLDVVDYHVYAWPFCDPTENMGGLDDLIALMDKYGVDKPLWNGEFGAYRSLWEDGARAQAGAWVRYLTVAHTYDRLARVGAHFHDANGWGAASDRGQFPAYVAYRVCADNLEGAANHEHLSLGPQVAAYRFQQGGGRVTVLWTRDGQPRPVVVQVREPKARVIELLGGERTVPAREGYVRITVGRDPVYVRE